MRFMVDDFGFLENFYDHKYNMYSLILKIISSSDARLAEDIHSGKIKRAFLYSNIIFPIINQKQKTKSSSHFHIYFTSPHKEVFNSMLKSISKVSRVNLNGFSINVIGSEVEIFNDVPNELVFLSPFVLRDKTGHAPEDFSEEYFANAIKDGILRTANALRGNSSLNFDIKFVFGGEANFKKKRYIVKDTVVRAWSATSPNDKIVFSGDPLAKMIALFYGIGDKTHMGFGMLGLPQEENVKSSD